MIPEQLTRPYNPKEHEEAIYKRWEDAGCFNPEKCIDNGYTKEDAQPFTIVLPPPNVTGTLHAGHAARVTTEDIMTRYKRMQGYRTLWVPGTDHAAIATQSKVEKILKKEENKSRHDLGREEFLRRVEAFAKESHDTIVNQVRRTGASLDWTREAYTLDAKRNFAVRTAFKRMYDAGLIVRGNRIVNWDPKGQTVISDDEIVYKEEVTKFYYLKYGPFIIGTARPETKFGDKYVVMHPKDERYKEYTHGQKIDLEWINGPITATIIKDEEIDMTFGTGVMTITPAHSMVDFEMAGRHGLDVEQIIDKRGVLLPIAGEFAGQHIKKAREAIIEKLQRKGLVDKIDDKYVHNIATAERTEEIIEPQIMLQWFVAVNKPFTLPYSEIEGIKSGDTTTLKDIMRKQVESGAVKFVPDRFSTTYMNWVNNLRDWCISRQLWYGHRIPVWYCKPESTNTEAQNAKCLDPIVEIEPVMTCPHCGGPVTQDEDTLDTWFSSSLWTFSTLGWPDSAEASSWQARKGSDLEIYHPTSVLETAYEIIPLWVSRMIMMAGFHLGTIPFHTTYIGGLVKDAQGRKFSKSLNNGVDPIETIEKFGTDALRMALVVGSPPGADSKIGDDKIKAYKHFSNKLWNITRFVQTETEDFDKTDVELDETDKVALARMNEIIASTTAHLDKYNFHLASEELYHYVWHEFADKYIEESKVKLRDSTSKSSAQYTLRAILSTSLRLLHPFMPYVTEAIWDTIKKDGDRMLIVTPWPTSQA